MLRERGVDKSSKANKMKSNDGENCERQARENLNHEKTEEIFLGEDFAVRCFSL